MKHNFIEKYEKGRINWGGLADLLIDWLIDWLVGWLAYWLIDWLIQ